MICISCWSHGNRLDSIVALLWSRQALIHFSFTLLAKHIMWIWSFVPDSPRLTSLSPQAPDASQRSRGGGEEFRGIQRLLWLPGDSARLPRLPPSITALTPWHPPPNHPRPSGSCSRMRAHAGIPGLERYQNLTVRWCLGMKYTVRYLLKYWRQIRTWKNCSWHLLNNAWTLRILFFVSPSPFSFFIIDKMSPPVRFKTHCSIHTKLNRSVLLCHSQHLSFLHSTT